MITGLESVRVLLLEDNQHMRTIVSAILAGAGVREIRECSDAKAALRLIREHPIDIAMVDFQLAGMDGVEFIREVRNNPTSPNPYLPIIMITGHSERKRVMEARDAGVTEFVVKPLTARALLARIEAVIFRPRPFIRCANFFGPDRRRKEDPKFNGPWRRAGDNDFEITPAPVRRR
jgi:DNA-binding response OmpR family regulator